MSKETLMYEKTLIDMLMHGHDCEFKIIKPSKKLILVEEEIDRLRTKEIIRLYKEELSAAKNESENFLKSHFNLHKIFFVNENELNNELSKYDFKNIYQANRVYKKLLKKIEPYQLPIELAEREDYRFGQLQEIQLNSKNLKLYKIAPLANLKITLGNPTTNCTGSIITHEITHSQINFHKGNIKSYYNQEVISIFIQLVHNFEKSENDLEIDKFFRLIEIGEAITELREYHETNASKPTDDLFEFTKYLESTLKAFMLFEIYLNSNFKVKTDILNHIQKIFDGKSTVERLLEKYNITMEKGEKSAKRFAKQIKREFTN